MSNNIPYNPDCKDPDCHTNNQHAEFLCDDCVEVLVRSLPTEDDVYDLYSKIENVYNELEESGESKYEISLARKKWFELVNKIILEKFSTE
jgi:hypothetical protein